MAQRRCRKDFAPRSSLHEPCRSQTRRSCRWAAGWTGRSTSASPRTPRSGTRCTCSPRSHQTPGPGSQSSPAPPAQSRRQPAINWKQHGHHALRHLMIIQMLRHGLYSHVATHTLLSRMVAAEGLPIIVCGEAFLLTCNAIAALGCRGGSTGGTRHMQSAPATSAPT